MKEEPPKYAVKFLNWILKPELKEEVLGDLEEKYLTKVAKTNKRKADLNYYYQTFNYLRPFAIKKISPFSNLLNSRFMIKNYLKITRRNMVRQPINTLLNLICLTIGMAAALLILLYVNFEINYDRFHEKAAQIYRVETPALKTDKVIQVGWTNTSALIAPYMKKDYPEVEATARIYQFFNNESIELELDGKKTIAQEVVVADSTTLDIFTFDFIYGGQKDALQGPNKVLLTKSLATKIFGNIDPTGKVINTTLTHHQPNINPNYALQVTGVYEDLPQNSHLDLEAMISAESDPVLNDYYFNRVSFTTYALLKEGTDTEALSKKLTGIYTNYLDANIEPVLKEAYHSLVPLTSIHLNATGGYTYLYIFSAIGLLMLLIAVISYVNLVTAQASKRALEIGVRKVMGSTRTQIIVQFLAESLAFSLLATLLALVLVYYSITPLNTLLGLQIDAAQMAQSQVVAGVIFMLILLAILGGSYPALFLSAFQPIDILKGKLAKGNPVRRALVAIQFGVVIFVLVSTGMIYEQLQFMRQKDLGFNKEQIVHIELDVEDAQEKATLLKTTLAQNSIISSVGTASFVPGLGMGRRPISADNGTSKAAQFVHLGSIGYDYLKTMDIELVDGRNYSIEHPSDLSEHVIINRKLAEDFGLKKPVGERIRFGDSGNPNFKTIVGVVEDFHQSTLHNDIAAQLFLLAPTSYNLAVKTNGNTAEAIVHIEKSWKAVFPNEAFSFRFLDDDLANAYETDQVRGRIFILFSCITILIAFLGLFGLVAYIAQQRVKEIGIRRVLGASTWNVVSLISKDFLVLVSLAAIPAFIGAWYFCQQWLESFAYRTEMNYLLFGLVLIFTLVLTFTTTSLHAIRTVQLNPADTLKTE